MARRPVEAEIVITTRCDRACPCCYVGASPSGTDITYDTLVQRLDYLASLEPFHVALGGGEPLLHPDLFRVAEHAAGMGMLLSTTTSGRLVTPAWAERAAALFSRVNVSIDLPGGPKAYSGEDVDQSWRAIRVLREAGVASGANFIVTQGNLERLPEAFDRAAGAGADSILLLRLKPGARGVFAHESAYAGSGMLPGLLPLAERLYRETGLDFHLDCALAPLILSSDIPDQHLARWAVAGCIAGSLLATVDAQGMVRPCSHMATVVCDIRDLPAGWLESPLAAGVRRRWQRQTGNCAACPRLPLCGGGCAAVAQRLHLGLHAPDPGLPCTRSGGGTALTRTVGPSTISGQDHLAGHQGQTGKV
jgi:radical SAM protein with 4Fe4S-binding SPASM domain